MPVHSKPEFNTLVEEVSVDNSFPVQTQYYKNFSKYVVAIDPSNEEHQLKEQIVSYGDWLKTPSILKSSKLLVLKSTARNLGIRVSGNKTEVANRIEEQFHRIKRATKIQSVFRGFLVRQVDKLRGPGFDSKIKCVNDTDFQTMDLIQPEYFFSYQDTNGFVYGFDIFSLLTMFKQNTKFLNPYNREAIPVSELCRIYSLYKKILILYSEDCFMKRVDNTRNIEAEIEKSKRKWNMCYSDSSEVYGNIPETFDIYDINYVSPPAINNTDNEESEVVVDPIYQRNSASLIFLYQLSNEKTQDERIDFAFSKMRELLRGQVNPEWFRNLSRSDYDRFYHFYYIWWMRLNGLSEAEKWDVCGLTEPFAGFNSIDVEGGIEYYRELCLDLVEKMVFTGIDESRQIIGATDVMTVLTVVSNPARTEWPELFRRMF